MGRPGILIPVLAVAALFFGMQTFRAATKTSFDMPSSSIAAVYPGAAVDDPTAHAESIPSVSSVVARPVFRPDRKPFNEKADNVPLRNYERELSGYTLLGVMFLGDGGKAVISGKTAGRSERFEVGPGESLPGFDVKEIRQDGVVLTADGKEFALNLYTGAPRIQGTAGLRTEVSTPRSSQPSQGKAQAVSPYQARAGSEFKPATTGQSVAGATGAGTPSASAGAPMNAIPVNRGQYRGKVRPTYVPAQR
jgi:hypothetical protein